MKSKKIHVSIIAIQEVVLSTLAGIFDVLNSLEMLAGFDDAIPSESLFDVEILGLEDDPVHLASGLPIQHHRKVSEVENTDIIIVPSVLLSNEGWITGRYPELVTWLNIMHKQGALLCSACSGVFLLAETGLFDERETTIHWSYAKSFRKTYPLVFLQPEKALVCSGQREELVSSGASNSWHDLVLYLIAREIGPSVAQSIAKFFALQWHYDGLAPYMKFEVPTDHGDAVVNEAQIWLAKNFSVANPVEEIVVRSGLAERSFKRRFTNATEISPIAYVQRLRIEDAKKRLERTDESIDKISWHVGYEDASYFRRLFKRITGISPSQYRRKFNVPDYNLN